jgi:three-Cys-motif partner protein
LNAEVDQLCDAAKCGSCDLTLKDVLSSPLAGDAIVSFNWDTVAERLASALGRSLVAAGQPPLDYFNVNLLKPHGSLSWLDHGPGRDIEWNNLGGPLFDPIALTLQQALGALDEDPSELETLLKLVEKVAFDSNDVVLTTPLRSGVSESPPSAAAAPATSLALDAVGRKMSRRRRSLARGDIGDLLDAFGGRSACFRTGRAPSMTVGLLETTVMWNLDRRDTGWAFVQYAARGQQAQVAKADRWAPPLKSEFPELAADIDVRQGDANEEIRALCAKDWSTRRAVMFLDPYGMQVEWATVEAVAATKAIDLWILFPLGIGVNRLLTRSGEIPPSWRRRLDLLLGSPDWYEAFYKVEHIPMLFDTPEPKLVKATTETIGKYFNDRLAQIFSGVAPKPRVLLNSANCPLYLLCFAVGNSNGAPIALRIANHLLETVA